MAKLESYINNILLNIMLYFTIIILASIWVPSYGQRIRLFQYRQEDSETNCTHGLISDVDTVVFKAEVDLSGLNNMRYVYFQLKSKSDSHFTTFKSIVINGSVAEKYSWEIIRPQVAQITIKDKAKTEYSFASIRGIVVTSDFKEVISDQQIFPEIRESTDIKISLLTNGVETPIQNNVCDIRVTEANIVIIFECQSQTVPCLIEISATDLMTPLLGKGYVLHTSKMPELNITIKYATCTFHGKINEINCRIKHDDILETIVTKKEFNTYTVHILYGAAITISVIFNIGFLIPLLWKSNRLRFLKVLCCIKSKKEYSFSGNNFIKVTQVKEFSDKTKKLLNNIDLAKGKQNIFF
ncbi:unnamed protein product [Lymnaea stagnalis]|uniref:Uncharacterized protein n=1 Tax=Lymnaea stagnalis TaxID=6523 RepID=A0AAV2HCL9_LYMST